MEIYSGKTMSPVNLSNEQYNHRSNTFVVHKPGPHSVLSYCQRPAANFLQTRLIYSALWGSLRVSLDLNHDCERQVSIRFDKFQFLKIFVCSTKMGLSIFYTNLVWTKGFDNIIFLFFRVLQVWKMRIE